MYREKRTCVKRLETKRILFFIESLSGGGAEKVLSTIVKHIDTQKFDVTVCVITAGGEYDEDVANYVRLYPLLKRQETYHGVGKIWYRLKYHLIYDWLPRRMVCQLFLPRDCDVEIAFVEGFATKLLSYSTNSKAKKIAWVHCDLKNQPWPIQKGIYRNKEEETEVYRKYHKVVCVSKQAEQVMKEYYGLSNTKTIYNPLDSAEILKSAKQPCSQYVDATQFNVVVVGRLERVKGYDFLIPIIHHIREKGANVHLWIVGEGSEAANLNHLVQDNGLENGVTFTGFLKNPYSLMSQMDLFVCSSRAEGYSLVVAEALILGIPVVSMRCLGPEELLDDGKYGALCDNYEQLENIIAQLVKDRNKYEDLKHMAEGAMERFDIEQTMLQVSGVL